jgi:hypothetical protein
MSFNQPFKSALECRDIQITKDADCTCYIERYFFGQELVQEPERLLAVRKRTFIRRLW